MPALEPAVTAPTEPPADDTATTWTGLVDVALPVARAQAWVEQPHCGAVVCFTGVVRDHAEGRDGVQELTYEAYEAAASARLAEVAADARRRWPEVARVAALHRVGRLEVGDPAVVVAVSAPHRHDAFEAASWCIDVVKDAVPIWKHEQWAGGRGWGTDARPVADSVDAAGRDVGAPAGGDRP